MQEKPYCQASKAFHTCLLLTVLTVLAGWACLQLPYLQTY